MSEKADEDDRTVSTSDPFADPDQDPRHLRSTYVESQVIITAVRVVAPFSLTYGLFLTFHGADTPGGSFQGGAIIGATVLMIAFAFGIEPTRDWLRNRTVVAMAAGGTAVFTIVGLVPLLFGDSFLAHPFYEQQWGIDTKWGLEAIEVGGIAPIVAGVVIGLFFVIAAGSMAPREESVLPEADVMTNDVAEMGTDPDVEMGTDPDAEMGTDPDAEMGTDPDVEIGTDPDAEMGADSEHSTTDSESGETEGEGR